MFPDPEFPAGAQHNDRPDPHAPVADGMRPRTPDEVVGHRHLLAPPRLLRLTIERSLSRSIVDDS